MMYSGVTDSTAVWFRLTCRSSDVIDVNTIISVNYHLVVNYYYFIEISFVVRLCCLLADVTSALNTRMRPKVSGVVATKTRCGNPIRSRRATVSADIWWSFVLYQRCAVALLPPIRDMDDLLRVHLLIYSATQANSAWPSLRAYARCVRK